jgi:hypothetical protein
MKKFKGVIRTNKIGSDCNFEFEVDENATEEEIDEIAKEVAFESIDWYYEQES